MKNTLKYIFTASMILFGFVAGAQNYQNGVSTNKTVKDNGDGTYTLTLESFVTGMIQHENEREDATPLDITFLLDVSGSMRGSKLTNLQTAVNNFINKISQDAPDAQIGIVKFSGGVQRGQKITTTRDYTPLDVNKAYQVYTRYSLLGFTYEIDDLIYYNGSNWVTVEGQQLDYNFSHDIFEIEVGNTSGKTQIVSDLTMVNNSANVKALTSSISNLEASGATSADYGMLIVKNVLASARENSNKVLIMFTDGEPTHNNGFQNNVANLTISTSKQLKDNDVTVYTVGTFDSTDDADVNTYMSYVSSNYPSAQSMTVSGSPSSEQKYYKVTRNASDLNSIFEAIYNDIPKGQSDNESVTDSAQVYDEMTNDFILPRVNNAIDLSSISYSVIPLTGISTSASNWDDRSKWSYNWGDPDSSLEKYGSITITPDSVVRDNKSFDHVSVTGFKFQDYFCGPEIATDGTVSPHGAKLVINITIIQNPDAPAGGVVSTNTAESGIYVGGINTSPIATYPIPVAPANVEITLTNAGLKDGDSAIYEISANSDAALGGKVLSVLLTSSDNVARLKVKSAVSEIVNGVETGEYIPITYTVVEKKWNWTYTNSTKTIEHPVLIIKGSGDSKTFEYNTEFNFSGSKKAVSVKHSETTK